MSRFVSQGGLTKEEFKAVQEKEEQDLQQHRLEEAEKERKSLYQQLKDNRARIEKENEQTYRKKYNAHHIDEDAKRYYEHLKDEEIRKEADLNKELDEGVRNFHEFQSRLNKSKHKKRAPAAFKVSKKAQILKKKPLKKTLSSHTMKEEPPVSSIDKMDDKAKQISEESNSLGRLLVSNYLSSDND